MRKGLRGAAFAWAIALIWAVVPVVAAPGDPRATVRMTVEIDWTVPAMHGPVPVEIGVSEGRLLGAVLVAATGAGPAIGPGEDGRCTMPPGRAGRFRARVEAPLGATLTIQAGPQPVRVPLLRLVDGPVRTLPPTAIDVGAARVAWDAVEVDPGGFSGTAAPVEEVPIRVGFNILSADAAEVDLKFTAELKSSLTGTVAWHQDYRAIVATNTLEPTAWMLPVLTPGNEGLYLLEVRATWEPAGGGNDGNRISRLLRRRKPASSGAVSRRVSLVVVDPKARLTPEKPGRVGAEETVDSLDLSRPRGRRPSASGRSPGSPASWRVPEAALVEETRRDRLRGWVPRVDSEPVILPAADANGMAWSAVGLKVPHPDRPHRLTVTVVGGHPAALGVGLVATSSARGRPRLALDACASGPPLIEGDRPARFSWLVWPEAAEPVLVLVNRNAGAPVHLGSVTLAELGDISSGPTIVSPGDGGRVVGVDLTAPSALDRFGGGGDPLLSGRNLIRYLTHCGATAVVLPDTLADRARRIGLDRQGDEDPVGPDRLDLLLTLLDRHGMSAWVDLDANAPLPGLPTPDTSEALTKGLVRVDRAGKADGPTYHPIHPEVRKALAKRVAATASSRKSHPGTLGVLVRLGPGATLLGRPDTGLDDTTFTRFFAATFDPGLAQTIPGLAATDVERFEARAKFLEGAQKHWLTWRARELAAVYAELAEAARKSAPGARLAVVTPDLDAGTVSEEVRQLDRRGLGPAQAWRSVGLDLTAWPNDGSGPIVLRGAGMSADEFARDLAASPELDEQVAARPARGLWLSSSARREATSDLALHAPALADGMAVDEPLGHALAALDGRWFFVSSDVVAGREDRVRRFAQVVRALPAPPDGPAEPRPSSGVAARLLKKNGDAALFLALANDTPYPIQLETIVRCPEGTILADLARTAPLNGEPVAGGLRVIADLPPFGVASARIDAPGAAVESISPHPSAAVLDGMKAQYDDLSVTLARLKRQAGGTASMGPANADFEAPALTLVSGHGKAGVTGWQAMGDDAAAVAIDPENAHAGRTSLRLDAANGPASVVSDPFAPAGRSSLTIQAWLRSERADARVRLWIEGSAAGRPYARQLELAIRSEWMATGQIRATGIPDTGLESARLRFELLTPGRLWLDDVTVSGPALSESERFLASRDLMAALSAYRDHRYADFARLAGSHWTRHVAEPGSSRLAGDRAMPIRTVDPSPSALPTARRLR